MDKNIDEILILEEDTVVDTDEGKNQERINTNKNGKLSQTGSLAAGIGTITSILLSVVEIDSTTSDAGLQAEDFELNSENSLITKVCNYFSKRRKGAAKNSDRASRVLEIVADASGIPQIKAFSLAFREAAAYLTKKEREKLSVEEENEILNKLGFTKEDIETKSEFQDLKNEIDKMQGKVDRLLHMVSSMSYLNGCSRILEKFRAMSSRDEKYMSEWANEFYRNKDNFSESLSDFSKKNVYYYLNYVYEMKCHKNMEQLFEAFGFLVHSRTLYKLILAKYYANVTDHIFNENPDLVPEERILKEIELCERDIEVFEKVADSVVGVESGGFIAMMNSKAKLSYVPRFQDISDDNCIGDFSQNDLVIMPMKANVKYKLFSNEGKESIYSSKPAFIKCKSTTNDYESIVAFKDGFVHRASGFRTKFKNGSECLGKVTTNNIALLCLGEKIEIYLNGNIRRWQKDLVWKDIKDRKGFSDLKYFEKTPEYYVMNSKEVKIDMDVHKATERGLIGTVKYHLLQGVKVDEKDSEGCTPLMNAAWHGNMEIVRLLIKNGANVNDKDNIGKTPLVYAAEEGYLEIVIVLISKGANLNDKNSDGNTPLVRAARGGFLEIVKVLINHGAFVNDKDKYGKTPLMYAVNGGFLEIVTVLINNGANVNDQDNDELTPIMEAARLGYLEIVKVLLNNGANVNDKNNKGMTPLMHASEGGFPEIVTELINKEANINDKNNYGFTPLIYAAERGYLEIVKVLILKGANVNDKISNGETPLMKAATGGYLEIVTVLLNNGANKNDKNIIGHTALWFAETYRHTEVVELLRSKGGKNKQNNQ